MNCIPRFLITSVVVLLAAGCGDGAATPTAAPRASDPTAPTDPPTTTEVPATEAVGEALGGFGAPAAAAGEFDHLGGTWAIAGSADLDARGCWWIVGEYDRGLLNAPTGTEVGDTGTSLVGADGSVVSSGTRVDIAGDLLYAVDELPGGADGRWGEYVSFCGADRPIVVAATLAVHGETDVAAAAAELGESGAALFDTDHGCGYGFAIGSTDQRWALLLYASTSDPIEAGTITLPDARFSAVVQAGQQLFANHCDDVLEWFEPNPEVAATWPIIGGSFDYPGSDGSGDCGQGAITTTLVGAVVDVDGTAVELGSIEIENRSFGCFAG